MKSLVRYFTVYLAKNIILHNIVREELNGIFYIEYVTTMRFFEVCVSVDEY